LEISVINLGLDKIQNGISRWSRKGCSIVTKFGYARDSIALIGGVNTEAAGGCDGSQGGGCQILNSDLSLYWRNCRQIEPVD
jgi:hypothetical protein